MGTLYLVATPIGNLEDISARALRILSQVGLIAAEDTRHTGVLLKHFEISTPMTSYYEYNKLGRLDEILKALSKGDVALVSDAGTPALNDPGYELVCSVLAAGYAVSSIPGPSAPIAALVASGLPTDHFLYLGYLPRKAQERKRLLLEVAELPYTLIFLESPHRFLDSISQMLTIFGDRQIAVARELTKLYEEIFRGTIAEAHNYFTISVPRGEFTLVVQGKNAKPEKWDEADLMREANNLLHQGCPPTEIASRLAGVSGWSRRETYRRVTGLPSAGSPDKAENES